MQPLSFQPNKTEVDSVPLEVYNKITEEMEALQAELIRCRQKVAHLLKEKEGK